MFYESRGGAVRVAEKAIEIFKKGKYLKKAPNISAVRKYPVFESTYRMP